MAMAGECGTCRVCKEPIKFLERKDNRKLVPVDPEPAMVYLYPGQPSQDQVRLLTEDGVFLWGRSARSQDNGCTAVRGYRYHRDTCEGE